MWGISVKTHLLGKPPSPEPCASAIPPLRLVWLSIPAQRPPCQAASSLRAACSCLDGATAMVGQCSAIASGPMADYALVRQRATGRIRKAITTRPKYARHSVSSSTVCPFASLSAKAV